MEYFGLPVLFDYSGLNASGNLELVTDHILSIRRDIEILTAKIQMGFIMTGLIFYSLILTDLQLLSICF